VNPLESVRMWQYPLTDDSHVFELKVLIELRATEGTLEMRDDCFIPRDKGRELLSTGCVDMSADSLKGPAGGKILGRKRKSKVKLHMDSPLVMAALGPMCERTPCMPVTARRLNEGKSFVLDCRPRRDNAPRIVQLRKRLPLGMLPVAPCSMIAS
jgi:hypothetical protein